VKKETTASDLLFNTSMISLLPFFSSAYNRPMKTDSVSPALHHNRLPSA
jgi:hypothetical protein